MKSKKKKKGFTELLSAKQWARIGAGRRSGVLLPLFSVFSSKSNGIADLLDLKTAIEWCAKTGNSIIQLLPMNELGSTFCPYDSVSSFALEPSYLALGALKVKDKRLLGPMLEEAKNIPPPKEYVDYGIKEKKVALLKKAYLSQGCGHLQGFSKFSRDNAYWLDDFVLFKVLKDLNNQAAWYDWHPEFRDRDPKAISGLLDTNGREVEFYKWVQWQLFEQFREAKCFAQERGVFLKGDLPILVSRDSADVWAHREFFKMDYAAGAPPDMYCSKGQRWGAPTYDWESIFADGSRYVKEKLKYASNFYDILRIDHVVGLFRIWSIPYNDPHENQGLNGSFDPCDEKLWGEQGRKILPMMLENSSMLLCAEDLGTVPKVCTDVLEEFGIPGNEVQRWVKDWTVKHDFLPPKEYRQMAVAMLSTHDTTNWVAWWEHEAGTIDAGLFKRRCQGRVDYDAIKNRLFDLSVSRHGRLRWRKDIDSVDKLVWVLGRKREELLDFIDFYENSFLEKEKLLDSFGFSKGCKDKPGAELLEKALKVTLGSRCVFCIELVTDWLYLAGGLFHCDSYKYRINTPGAVSHRNWSLLMPLSLEELICHPVCSKIKSLILESKRSSG